MLALESAVENVKNDDLLNGKNEIDEQSKIDIINESSDSDDVIDDVSGTIETADTGQNELVTEENDESEDNIISITEYKKNQFGASEKIEEKETVEVTTAAEEF